MIKNIILVIVAHTDDESLGLGGTIAKHVANGDDVFAISMTDGVSSRRAKKKEDLSDRVNASINAGKILGLTWLDGGNYPDNAMDTVPLLEVIKLIEGVKSMIKPTLIYTHSSADLNIDHRVVNHATLTAFRPQTDELWQEIRSFEVPSATDFGHRALAKAFYPNLYINITNTWEIKCAALKEYEMEMRSYPHVRSLKGAENLAKYRGNQVGLYYAEAFEVIRKIER